MKETITLKVKVKLNYDEPIQRKEAIKLAKKCVLAQSVLGSITVQPKSSKLIKNENTN